MRNEVKEISIEFAIRIVNLYKYLCNEKKEFIMSKQVLRSGTAIGALVSEGEFAESKADFAHKMAIALKEANETKYWLYLLKETDYLSDTEFDDINKDVLSLVGLLVAIVKSAKGIKK